ncbi:MAG: permease-like cell division protein FtsX [Pseudomonadota bacterium]
MATRQRSAQGAKNARPSLTLRLRGWLFNHSQALTFSVAKLAQTPIASAMTCLVIAIALALPATFSVLLGNAQTLSDGWDVDASVTLYLHAEVDDADGAALARELNGSDGVADTRFIGRDEALATFRKFSGFGDVLDALDDNPLPASIVLQLQPEHSARAQLQQMAEEMAARKEVETAQVDLEWIQRLNAIIELMGRGVLVVGALLALAVLLIIGNTIRLDIHNRRDEIVVIKLIGATDAFVRRPFLYGGLVYGFVGGVLSAMLVAAALLFVSAPAEQLADLYGSGAQLAKINWATVVALVVSSTLLGLIGSWLSVGRHIREVEPK